MVFTDKEFYAEQYLMGRPPIIPIEQVEFWLMEASAAINFKNIPDVDLEVLLAVITETTATKLKRATCRIAEILYTAEQISGRPDAPTVKSETVNNKYTVSYVEQKRSEDEIQRDISRTALKWLAGTELHDVFVFRGGA